MAQKQPPFLHRLLYLLARIPGAYGPLIWFRRVGLRRLRWLLGSCSRFLPAAWIRLGAPKGTVSLYDLLKKNDPSVEGEIVLHRQEITPMGRGSLAEFCGLRMDLSQPFPVVWTRHKNARLVSQTLGLLLPGKRLTLESAYTAKSLWIEPAYQYFYLPKAVKLKGNYTSIVSYWVRNRAVSNFSHWLMDALPRLAVLESCPPDTIVLTPGKLAGYQQESLRLLVGDRFRPTPERHLEVENYYFSSPQSMIVSENAYGLNFLRRSFLPHASKSYQGPRRFVIDRSGATRGVQNAEEFNQFFRDLGWGIIDTATLSFTDEIKLFKDAEAFCGAIGSGFTNAIWSSPGCAVIQFVSKEFVDASTEWICARNDLKWRFMICPADHAHRLLVDLKKLRKVLEEMNLI